MKKLITKFSILFILIFLFILTGCGKKSETISKGKINLLSLIPADASGVFSINFEKITKLENFNKIVNGINKKEKKSSLKTFKNYQDFIDKTGIDPKRDLYSIALGLYGEIGKENSDIALVINLNYNRGKILDLFKKENKNYYEEKFNKIVIYKFSDKKNRERCFSFIDDKIIGFGSVARVKQIIDLFNDNGKSILTDEKKKPYLSNFNPQSVISFVFDFPEKAKKSEAQQDSPFKMDFSKAEILWGEANFENNIWSGKIKLISHDEEANKQIVNILNGIKGMGAMAGPEIAEILNKINLTSSTDNIELTFSIPNELLKKVQKKAEEKAKTFTTPDKSFSNENKEVEKSEKNSNL